MQDERFIPAQTEKVFLTGGNKNLIKEATVLKYTGGFYTIRLESGGGIKVRESRIYPSREEAEAAIQSMHDEIRK